MHLTQAVKLTDFRQISLPTLLALALGAALAACGDTAKLPLSAGIGASTGISLPPPNKTLIPTINVAPAAGWAAGATPVPHRASAWRRLPPG